MERGGWGVGVRGPGQGLTWVGAQLGPSRRISMLGTGVGGFCVQ